MHEMTQLVGIALVVLGSAGVIAWELWGIWMVGQQTDLRRQDAWR